MQNKIKLVVVDSTIYSLHPLAFQSMTDLYYYVNIGLKLIEAMCFQEGLEWCFSIYVQNCSCIFLMKINLLKNWTQLGIFYSLVQLTMESLNLCIYHVFPFVANKVLEWGIEFTWVNLLVIRFLFLFNLDVNLSWQNVFMFGKLMTSWSN